MWLHAGAMVGVGLGKSAPVTTHTVEYPVELNADALVGAMQVEVLFDSSRLNYRAPRSLNQPADIQLRSQLIEEGRLRVVAYRRGGSTLSRGTVFRLPFTAKSGTPGNEPVVLASLGLADESGSGLAGSIQPVIDLVGLDNGQAVNGRLGIELSLASPPANVTRVTYTMGGSVYEQPVGGNAPATLIWTPNVSGSQSILITAFDSTGAEVASRTLDLTVTHVDTYAGAVLGTYQGLVRGDTFNFNTDGFVTMTSSLTGAFTLKLAAGGKTFSGVGTFDADGNAVVTVPRGPGVKPLTVVLAHSSLTTVDQIAGRVADGTFSLTKFKGHTFETEFTVDRVGWDAKKRPAPMAGNYTLHLQPSVDAEAQGAPRGHGIGTAVISAGGSAALAGTLADGTALSGSVFVSKDGKWPLYAVLYAAKGAIIGQLQITDGAGSGTVSGTSIWMRPADPKALICKAGFTTEPEVIGAKYVKPTANKRTFPMQHVGGNGVISLSEGDLLADLDSLVTVNSMNVATVPMQHADRTAMKLTGATGLVSGSFVHPVSQKSVSYKGVVVQPQLGMAGHFLTGTFGGNVLFSANPAFIPGSDDALPIGTVPLPVIKIVSPAVNATLQPGAIVGGNLVIRGTAADAQGIAAVKCQVLHGGVISAPVNATGTTAWTYNMPYTAGDGGLYTVYAKAEDSAGNESELAAVTFSIALKGALTVNVAGPGSVSAGFLGTTQRDVDKLITITALPQKGKVFTGWTGAITSSAPKVTVLMKPGFTLTANFGDP